MQPGYLALSRTNPAILDDDLEIMTNDSGDLLDDVTDAGFDSRAEIHYLS